jgi:hypothetical protein
MSTLAENKDLVRFVQAVNEHDLDAIGGFSMISPMPEDESLGDALLRADIGRFFWWDIFTCLRWFC